MTTEAWIKRGGERQELLQTLQRALIDQEEEASNRVKSQLNTHLAFIEYFEAENGTGFKKWFETSERAFFHNKILPAIREFARTEEEVEALVAELFIWEAQSVANHFRAPLHTQEAIEPEKVFDGHQAMDRVEP